MTYGSVRHQQQHLEADGTAAAGEDAGSVGTTDSDGASVGGGRGSGELADRLPRRDSVLSTDSMMTADDDEDEDDGGSNDADELDVSFGDLTAYIGRLRKLFDKSTKVGRSPMLLRRLLLLLFDRYYCISFNWCADIFIICFAHKYSRGGWAISRYLLLRIISRYLYFLPARGPCSPFPFS